jgi:Response regulators consisting of a CheY-like receiver domain and a winged-helix DNA-binding domain
MAWDIDFDPQTNLVDVYVGYLRRKLGSAPSPPSAGQATACQPAASQHHPMDRTVTDRGDDRTGHGQHRRLDRRRPVAAHSDPFGAVRACRHPITERAQIGGYSRAGS